MSAFARVHAARFDELERQGVFSVDVVQLARAVLDAQMKASPDCRAESYRRCEACE